MELWQLIKDSKATTATLGLLTLVAIGVWTAAVRVQTFDSTIEEVKKNQNDILASMKEDRDRDLDTQRTRDEAQDTIMQAHTTLLSNLGAASIRMEERLQNFDRLVEMRFSRLESGNQ